MGNEAFYRKCDEGIKALQTFVTESRSVLSVWSGINCRQPNVEAGFLLQLCSIKIVKVYTTGPPTHYTDQADVTVTLCTCVR